MPLGIIDDYKLEHVPGTAPLSELNRLDTEVAGVDSGLLKHDSTGQIVLVPQPSDSPNDPYNWPRWKKEMFTLVIAYGCGCVGGMWLRSGSRSMDTNDEQPSVHCSLQHLSPLQRNLVYRYSDSHWDVTARASSLYPLDLSSVILLPSRLASDQSTF
jgi:hypothetical protein